MPDTCRNREKFVFEFRLAHDFRRDTDHIFEKSNIRMAVGIGTDRSTGKVKPACHPGIGTEMFFQFFSPFFRNVSIFRLIFVPPAIPCAAAWPFQKGQEDKNIAFCPSVIIQKRFPEFRRAVIGIIAGYYCLSFIFQCNPAFCRGKEDCIREFAHCGKRFR